LEEGEREEQEGEGEKRIFKIFYNFFSFSGMICEWRVGESVPYFPFILLNHQYIYQLTENISTNQKINIDL